PSAPSAPSSAPMTPTLGIQNIGATCWMNTLLQHLRNTNDFVTILVGPVHHARSEEDHNNLQVLQLCLREMIAGLRDAHIAQVTTKQLTDLVTHLHTCGIIQQAHSSSSSSSSSS